jgi:membrane-bound ClpP family serine protease
MIMPWLLLALGLFLIYLEFYVPGAILGTFGGIAILTGIVVFAQNSDSIITLLAYVLFVLLSIGLLIRFTLKRIRSTAGKGTIYLQSDQEGYVASQYDQSCVGKEGVAASDLKPSGHIYVDGMQHQAVAETGYVTKGTRILVIGGRGAYLIVKSVNKETKS